MIENCTSFNVLQYKYSAVSNHCGLPQIVSFLLCALHSSQKNKQTKKKTALQGTKSRYYSPKKKNTFTQFHRM